MPPNVWPPDATVPVAPGPLPFPPAVLPAGAGRVQIPAALANVPDVTAWPFAPATPAVGDAWALWIQTTWTNEYAREYLWHVYVALPAPDTEAATRATEWQEEIGAALANISTLDLIEPVGLVVGQAGEAIPCLRFTIRTN